MSEELEEIQNQIAEFGDKRFASTHCGAERFRIGFVDWFTYHAISRIASAVHVGGEEGLSERKCMNCGATPSLHNCVEFQRNGYETMYLRFMLCDRCFKALRPYIHETRHASKFFHNVTNTEMKI